MNRCYKEPPHIFVFEKNKSIKCNKVVPTTIIIHRVRFILPVWENSYKYTVWPKKQRLRDLCRIFFPVSRFIWWIKSSLQFSSTTYIFAATNLLSRALMADLQLSKIYCSGSMGYRVKLHLFDSKLTEEYENKYSKWKKNNKLLF